MCIDCGTRRADEGSQRCLECKKIHSQKNKQYREKNISDGRCIRCGANLEDDKHTSCKKCRNRANELKKERELKRIEKGLCPKCGNKKEDDSYSLCEKCREYGRKDRSKRVNIRIEKGLCPRCGNKMDRDGYYCASCAADNAKRNVETYYLRKSLNICPGCGKYSVPESETYCPECKAKNANWYNKYYEENKEKVLDANKKSSKKRKQRLAEQGLCVRCGKRATADGAKECRICREKQNEQRKENYQHGNRNWMEDKFKRGICRWCDKPIDEGRVFCPECYEKAKKNMRKAYEASPWSKNMCSIFERGKENEQCDKEKKI